MMGNFSCFCCNVLTFFKLLFQNILSGTLSECSFLDPDEDRRSGGPDLGSNCLQRLSAEVKSHLALARK